MIFITLFIVFIILNYFDATTTLFVCKHLGIQSEKNPIAKILMKKFGLNKGIILLKSVIILIIPLIIIAYLNNPIAINIVLILLNICYLLIVINNKRICKRIKNNQL